MELDEFGLPVWDFPLPLYAPNDPIAYDRDDAATANDSYDDWEDLEY
jgi:hypothetical protein